MPVFQGSYWLSVDAETQAKEIGNGFAKVKRFELIETYIANRSRTWVY